MTFSYDKLWCILEQRHLKKEDLRRFTGISSATIAKLGKNKNINMNSIGKLCKFLDCNIGDIVDYQDKDELSDIK